jgi:hypothetical protein
VKYREFANELVAAKVDVIVTTGNAACDGFTAGDEFYSNHFGG